MAERKEELMILFREKTPVSEMRAARQTPNNAHQSLKWVWTEERAEVEFDVEC